MRNVRFYFLFLYIFRFLVFLLQFSFEPYPNGTHKRCHLKLKFFNRHKSDGNFKDIKDTDLEEWITCFNLEIKKFYSESSDATTSVNPEGSLNASDASASGDSWEDETLLNASLERSDLVESLITDEANQSSSGMQYLKNSETKKSKRETMILTAEL